MDAAPWVLCCIIPTQVALLVGVLAGSLLMGALHSGSQPCPGRLLAHPGAVCVAAPSPCLSQGCRERLAVRLQSLFPTQHKAVSTLPSPCSPEAVLAEGQPQAGESGPGSTSSPF